MSNKIAEAYVEISARLDRMDADLKKARASFSKATGDMQTNANKLEGGMSGLLTKVQAVRTAYIAAAAAVGGIVLAFGSAIKSTADHLDQLDEMSVKTGVSVEMLTSLELAAKQNGVSMQGLATSIRMMYRSMNEASQGTKEAAEAYKILGVDVRDAKGNLKSGNEAFIEVANAVAKIENPAQRSALAMKVFGRAGTEMLPMLEGGEKALRAYIAEAQRLGLVFTESDAKRAAAFNDALDTFNARLRAIKERIALETLPAITALLEVLTTGKTSKQTQKGFAQDELDRVDERIKTMQGHVDKLRAIADKHGTDQSKFKTLVDAETTLRDLYMQQYNWRKKLKDINDSIPKSKPTGEGGGTVTTPKGSTESRLGGFRDVAGAITYDWDKAAKKANESALAIRGVKTATTDLIGEFDKIPKSLETIKVSIGDQLVAPFQDMMLDLSDAWGSTIANWINGTRTFREVFKQMGDDIINSFANIVAQLAAQKLAASIFGDITGGLDLFGGFGFGKANITTGIDYTGGSSLPVGARGAPAGTTVINISAIDTQSFANAVRNNPDAVISIVSEANLYGRRMGN